MRLGGIVLLLVDMVRLDYRDIYHGKKFLAQRAGLLCTCPYNMQSFHDIHF